MCMPHKIRAEEREMVPLSTCGNLGRIIIMSIGECLTRAYGRASARVFAKSIMVATCARAGFVFGSFIHLGYCVGIVAAPQRSAYAGVYLFLNSMLKSRCCKIVCALIEIVTEELVKFFSSLSLTITLAINY